MTEEQREKRRVYQRTYYAANREKILSRGDLRGYNRRYQRKCRDRAEVLLGGNCRRCGLTGPRGFLDIDHIHGGGYRARRDERRIGFQQVLRYNRLGEDVTQRFQLLCPNCHRLKTLETQIK